MGRRLREDPDLAELVGHEEHQPAGPRLSDVKLHSSVVDGALGSPTFRQQSWRLVVNHPGRFVFGVAPGIYPDIVALDSSDAGVAWVLEVATPASLVDEAAWDRWSQIAGTGLSFILAVPFGSGHLTEKAAHMLDVRAGLVYEYGVTPSGVFFSLPKGITRGAVA